MKIAVSIPDQIFNQAERLAGELATSRSQLYSRVLRELLARHAPDQLTTAINRVVDVMGEEGDAFGRRAASLVFERLDQDDRSDW